MASVNPFRTRHSEAAARDVRQFTASFGPEILSVLPPPPFDQFYVIRSAPGAGKTSMMKALTAPIVEHVFQHKSRLSNLYEFLTNFGLMNSQGPKVFGVLENLDRGYAGFADLLADADTQRKLLFRLIDARLTRALVEGALTMAGLDATGDASVLELIPTTSSSRRALKKLGGSRGDDLLAAASEAEDQLLDLFDAIVLNDETLPAGHGHLYIYKALAGAQITVDNTPLRCRPVLMLDDAHVLAPDQLRAIFVELSDRDLDVGRWVAIRSVALDDGELLGAGDEGRDFEVIEIEALARERTSAGTAARRLAGQTLTHQRFRKMLLDIANSRSHRLLTQMLTDDRNLTDLLTVEPDSSLGPAGQEALAVLLKRVSKRAAGEVRYGDWLNALEQYEGRDGLARAAELEVLVERDIQRSQDDLFPDLPLGMDDASRRGSSALRDAALLRASLEFKLPYYFGPDTIARLGSANIEQFLELSGDLTARLISLDATGRPLVLTPSQQDSIVRATSRNYFNGLAQLPNGDLVQRFVQGIAAVSRQEAAKPTIPYPPGVTGTALSMIDRSRLRDEKRRREIAGASELYSALLTAIASNVVWIELDYSMKNGRWMVIYLNRLLCPTLNMPVGLGGFRERKLSQMAAWMTADPSPVPLNFQDQLV